MVQFLQSVVYRIKLKNIIKWRYVANSYQDHQPTFRTTGAVTDIQQQKTSVAEKSVSKLS